MRADRMCECVFVCVCARACVCARKGSLVIREVTQICCSSSKMKSGYFPCNENLLVTVSVKFALNTEKLPPVLPLVYLKIFSDDKYGNF